MYRPLFACAGGSNGQIFIAVMPLSSKLSAKASARFMNASRSSNGPSLSPTFQLDTGRILRERT
jgi:hypothetical protein